MSSYKETQLSDVMGGLTIGLGIWAIAAACQRTKASTSPSQDPFIYMIWGSILTNTFMGIYEWLLINNKIPHILQFYMLQPLFWLFGFQLYFQIAMNTATVAATNKLTNCRVRFGMSAVLVVVNIIDFIIWAPAKLAFAQTLNFVEVNKYWDGISKGILLLIDIGLNLYLLLMILQLISKSGLLRSKTVVISNAWLLITSIIVDALVIGLGIWGSIDDSCMSIVLHPPLFMIKLLIQLFIASLIAELKSTSVDKYTPNKDLSRPQSIIMQGWNPGFLHGYQNQGTVISGSSSSTVTHSGILKTLEFDVSIVSEAQSRELPV
ncbi:hypothetical protein BP6252_10870 [Coleophoma cylindrospora]|uniref:Integral membrane protein n=1 Tax=Coleophoma cylindrospora TaxID=1849047 RepID=A0A3D8QNE6_9HELO|nr:hypothetical protein BP6252_10870 [Coleophoma cylindrospora]